MLGGLGWPASGSDADIHYAAGVRTPLDLLRRRLTPAVRPPRHCFTSVSLLRAGVPAGQATAACVAGEEIALRLGCTCADRIEISGHIFSLGNGHLVSQAAPVRFGRTAEAVECSFRLPLSLGHGEFVLVVEGKCGADLLGCELRIEVAPQQ
jgi:hypothetical protein